MKKLLILIIALVMVPISMNAENSASYYKSYEINFNSFSPTLQIAGVDEIKADSTKGIPYYKFTYNDQNQLLMVEYRNEDDNLVNGIDADWFAYVVYKYNKYGQLIEEAYYDKDGTLRENRFGYAIVGYTYQDGKLKEKAFYNADRVVEVSANDDYSAAIQIIDVDKKTNKFSVINLDDNRNIIVSKFYPSKVVKTTKRRRVIVEDIYLDREGNLMTSSKGAIRKKIYTKKGKLLKEEFFNKENELLDKPAVAYIDYKYNRKGQKIEKRFYGKDKKLLNNDNGYAIVKYSYDKDGIELQEEYFDKNNQPVNYRIY